MPCRHGTPFANECTWQGVPPSCPYCEIEYLRKENASLLNCAERDQRTIARLRKERDEEKAARSNTVNSCLDLLNFCELHTQQVMQTGFNEFVEHAVLNSKQCKACLVESNHKLSADNAMLRAALQKEQKGTNEHGQA